MPSKGIRKLWEKVTGGKQNHVSKTVVPGPDLATLLTSVQLSLDDPASKLSAEKIEELHIRIVLRRVRQELVERPVIIAVDMTEIDHIVKYILNELQCAMERGFETAAHWSTAALAMAVNALYTPIPANDLEYSDALMAERLRYAQNLKLLVQNARYYDEYTVELAVCTRRYNQKKEALQALTEEIQTILDSEEGRLLMDDIRDHDEEPAEMKPAARELRDKLLYLNLLERDKLALSLDVSTAAEQRYLYSKYLDQIQNIVKFSPRVMDPKLSAKNQEALKAHAAELRRHLVHMEELLKPYDANLSELNDLVPHAVFQPETRKAPDPNTAELLRKLKEKEDELEAARAASREKKRAELHRIERSLAEEFERLAREETAEEDGPSNDSSDHSTPAP